MLLYNILEEEELKSFLISLGADPSKLALIEIMDEEEDLFGDFIIFDDYMFKQTYGQYQCMRTPTEVHKKRTVNFAKASGDRGKNYFTRYRSKFGGKDSFNPTTKTGGREKPSDTSKRLKL